MQSDIYWRQTASPPPAQPLQQDTDADIVIVGGGVAGLSAAQWLIEHGETGVVLLDAEHCGAGASGHNSGSVIPVAVQDTYQLLHRFGHRDGAELARAVNGGIEAIADTIKRFGIDCGATQTATLHAAALPGLRRRVEAEHEARRSIGLPSQYYSGGWLSLLVGTRLFKSGTLIPGSLGINCYRYVLGLRAALQERSLRIYENTPVIGLEPGRVITARASIRCRKVILCTDRMAPDLLPQAGDIHHQQHFMAVSESIDAATRDQLFPEGPLIVHGLAGHYHYFRLTPDDRLVVGGMPVRKAYAPRSRHPLDHVGAQLQWMRRWYPAMAHVRFSHGWSGLFGLSRDLLPLAGPAGEADDIHVAVCGGSVVWSLLAGRSAAETAIRGSSPLLPVFDPRRRFTPLDPVLRLMPDALSFPLTHAYAETLQTGDAAAVRRQQRRVRAGLMLLAAASGCVIGRRLSRRVRRRRRQLV